MTELLLRVNGNSLLFDADLMFLDANTWHPAEWRWHQSVFGNLRFVDKWRPKRAYMLHYSRYEDRDRSKEGVNGPMGMEQFRQELQPGAGCLRGRRLARDGDVVSQGIAVGGPVVRSRWCRLLKVPKALLHRPKQFTGSGGNRGKHRVSFPWAARSGRTPEIVFASGVTP
jgi:hypothetical protein